MGKLPPSMRNPNLNLLSLKPRPLQSHPQPPKPYRPPPPSAAKSKSKSKPKTAPPPSPPPHPAFLSPSLPAAITAFDDLLTSDLPKPHPHHLLSSFLSAGPSPSDALSLLHHFSLRCPDFAPDRRTFHALLAHSCSQPDPSPILSTIAAMSTAGFPPDPSSADLVVRALCTSSHHDTAASLLLDPASPLRPDLFTYNYLIRRLACTRPISAVKRFIHEMRTHPTAPLQPDLVTYTILIDTVCRNGNLREATSLLSVLSFLGFKPDAYLYNTVMKGYCMMDQCGEVMEVYKRMLDEKVEPDLVTYNTLIYGLSKSGRVDHAKKFLNTMAEMGHFPDVVTYTSLMNGMCRKGDAMGAMGLLGEMERKGCEPNDCTYNTLLMGLCKTQCLEKGMELYRVMKDGGMKLEKPTYATVVRVLCRAGKIAEAYGVFDYARESKSMSDVTAYQELESSLKWIKNAKARDACL